jgi:hypothetical protein
MLGAVALAVGVPARAGALVVQRASRGMRRGRLREQRRERLERAGG